MRHIFCLALLLIAPVAIAEDASSPSNTIELFDGETLNGWHGQDSTGPYDIAAMSTEDRQAKMDAWNEEAKKHWSVVDGILVNDGLGPFLTTDQEFGDYELWVSYKTVADADSGVYLKAVPQVQIWDSNNMHSRSLGANFGSGGLWNNPAGAPGKDPLVVADRALGQWNHMRIIQIGSRTSVWMNDQMVVDHAIMDNYFKRGEPLPKTGPIQLQTHGGEIVWKDIRIRPLSTTEANEYLASKSNFGFESVFNGKDLTGWIGAVDDYEVTSEGTIQCKPSKGGNLLTEKEYGNFWARVEFRLPPGGNNGLAIRAPNDGDAAYNAFCEFQVLDTEHPKYANIDPRQAHGSAYGMVAATRGFLRPTGEWNFQEVRVNGTQVRVELNGNVILNADIAEVKEFMAEREHPGMTRMKGHFGFAGHSDPVEYRNISIREF